MESPYRQGPAILNTEPQPVRCVQQPRSFYSHTIVIIYVCALIVITKKLKRLYDVLSLLR